jgi:hypothetical protein
MPSSAAVGVKCRIGPDVSPILGRHNSSDVVCRPSRYETNRGPPAARGGGPDARSVVGYRRDEVEIIDRSIRGATDMHGDMKSVDSAGLNDLSFRLDNDGSSAEFLCLFIWAHPFLCRLLLRSGGPSRSARRFHGRPSRTVFPVVSIHHTGVRYEMTQACRSAPHAGLMTLLPW